MDWFGKDIKDNSLKRKFTEKPLTDALLNFFQIMFRNKMRSIILFFAAVIFFSIVIFKISADGEEDPDRPRRDDVSWLYKTRADQEYNSKRNEHCEAFKANNQEKYKNSPLELSIVSILPTRADEEMYNIFQSAMFAMETYLMKHPANVELIIVEWGADQNFKRKLDVGCSFAKVERIFVGNWLIDSSYKKRSEKQQLWETQMAANVGLQKVSSNFSIVIDYNDILTGAFFSNFRDLLKNFENDKLPLIQPIVKRKINYLFQGGISPVRVCEFLDKQEWESVATYEQEVDSANKNNDFPSGSYATSSWIAHRSVWNLLRGYPEVPVNINWQPVVECYAKEKIHPKIKTSKSFTPFIITLPRSSYQNVKWKGPHTLPNTDVWCKDIFLNSECWGIGNKLMRRTGYSFGGYVDEGDTKRVIDQEPQLRACDQVRVQQREHFTHLLQAQAGAPKNVHD